MKDSAAEKKKQYITNLKKLGAGLSKQQVKLMKAAVTGDSTFIGDPSRAISPEDALTLGEIKKFVEKARRSPNGLVNLEDELLRHISREEDIWQKKDNPEEYLWKGRRAKYMIARADLNKKVNELFNIKLPVDEYELSEDGLRAHYSQKIQVLKVLRLVKETADLARKKGEDYADAASNTVIPIKLFAEAGKINMEKGDDLTLIDKSIKLADQLTSNPAKMKEVKVMYLGLRKRIFPEIKTPEE